MKHTFEELQQHVLDWADVRGLLAFGDAKTQLLKTMSELGELADNTAKGDHVAAIDDVGDVLVTLIIFCYLTDIDMLDALTHAFEVINKRTGKMINGTFIKDIK